MRNGTPPRTMIIRVARLTLRVPRDRAALFQPAVFARYRRRHTRPHRRLARPPG